MGRFVADAPARSRVTERGYADWAGAQADAVSYRSAMDRYCGFAAIRAEAERRRRAA
jgi:hypothetical protein